MFTRRGRGCGDVTIARDEKRRLASSNDVTHRKRAEDFGRFWKSQLVENWTPNETVDFRLLAETFVAGARPGGGCWWKKQNRKIVPLSPYIEEPLNSKVIKCFVPEQRSRYMFFEFRDPMFYVYMLWTSHVHFAYSCIWPWYNRMKKYKLIFKYMNF